MTFFIMHHIRCLITQIWRQRVELLFSRLSMIRLMTTVTLSRYIIAHSLCAAMRAERVKTILSAERDAAVKVVRSSEGNYSRVRDVTIAACMTSLSPRAWRHYRRVHDVTIGVCMSLRDANLKAHCLFRWCPASLVVSVTFPFTTPTEGRM